MQDPNAKRILRYEEPDEDKSLGKSVSLEAVNQHVKIHIGEPSLVVHEIGSQYVHVDVHVVPPRPGREFFTLVTSGMSDKPMNAPVQAKGLELAELMLCLPSRWRLSAWDVVSAETWGKDWPVIWLRQLARFPHAYKTWLSWGHSVPNGDPPEPFSPEARFCGWVLLEPKLVSDQFKVLTREDGGKTLFHAAVPVFKEEMDLKIANGAERLEDLVAQHGITELVDPNRINVALKH